MSKLLLKQDVELALQKEQLISDLTRSRMKGSKKVEVHLTITYDFMSQEPLGGVDATKTEAALQLKLNQEHENITSDYRQESKVVERLDVENEVVNGKPYVENEETETESIVT